MTIRPFTLEDYPTIHRWWVDHKWTPLPHDLLPVHGFVVEENGVMILAGWLYQSDSKIGWLEWIISNPESTHEDRSSAIDLLINVVIYKAKELGMKALFSSLKHDGLMKKYLANGFVKTDENVTNFIRGI